MIDELDLFDNYGDEICEMCEKYILGCSRNSYFFSCEGRFCLTALDMFYDSNEFLSRKREILINKILENG